MLINTDTYHQDLTKLASNDMNKWNAQEEILEKNRDSLIFALNNLVHFTTNTNGEVVAVDEHEKPRYILTEKQLKILYKSEEKLLTILQETTEELLELSSNMHNSINKKNKKNRANQDILDSILKKREIL